MEKSKKSLRIKGKRKKDEGGSSRKFLYVNRITTGVRAGCFNRRSRPKLIGSRITI